MEFEEQGDDMSKQDDLNPVRLWREWMIKSEKMWSDVITDFMGDPNVSSSMGRSMQEFLHLHRMFSETSAQYLSMLNLPSRGDILDISDRLGQLEDAVAAVQIELREQRRLLAGLDGAKKKAPSRTKKPAAENDS